MSDFAESFKLPTAGQAGAGKGKKRGKKGKKGGKGGDGAGAATSAGAAGAAAAAAAGPAAAAGGVVPPVAAQLGSGGAAAAAAAGTSTGGGSSHEILSQKEFLALLKQTGNEVKDSYKFWDTQPVQKLGEDVGEEHSGPIDEPKTVADVRAEPYSLPEGYAWCSVDIDNEDQLRELYELLSLNYVEDDDNMFRFDYSADFLRWVLTPPGYRKDWLLGLRDENADKLVAFIAGIPVHCHIYKDTIPMAEINFLCIAKELRAKRLAPVLIKEITRLVNLQDVWQAVYTAGVVLPKPVSACRYSHRPLNVRKLIKVRFSHLSRHMTMARMERLHQVKVDESVKLVPMEARHVPAARLLANEFLKKHGLWLEFVSDEEFAHWMLPRPGVLCSYVIENEAGEATDFVSFYHLPSSILHTDEYDKLNAVYMWYTVANSVSLKSLMNAVLSKALEEGADVFNALQLQSNDEFLKDLKFGDGDGTLQYYLYNWKCPAMPPSQIGLIML